MYLYMVTIHVLAAQACNESVAHDQLLVCTAEVRETSSLHAHVAGMREIPANRDKLAKLTFVLPAC